MLDEREQESARFPSAVGPSGASGSAGAGTGSGVVWQTGWGHHAHNLRGEETTVGSAATRSASGGAGSTSTPTWQ